MTTLYFYTSSNGGSSFTASVSANRVFVQPNTLTPSNLNTSRLLTLSMNEWAFGSRGTSYLSATIYNGTACTSLGCGVLQQLSASTGDNGTTWSGPWTISGNIMPDTNSSGYSDSLFGEDQTVASFPDPLLSSGYRTLYAWPSSSCPSFALAPTGPLSECGTFGVAGVNQTTLYATTQVELSTLWTGATTSVTFTPSKIDRRCLLVGEHGQARPRRARLEHPDSIERPGR